MEVDNTTQDFAIAVPTRLKLVVTEGPCEGQTFDTASLSCSYLTVGRTKKSKIYIKDGAISEKHAEIAWDARTGAWTLRDTCSSNGTRVNDDKLQPYRPHCLKSGDLVMFGHETIVSVEVLEQTLSDINVETVLRAYLESVCQALEGNAAAAADEMLRTSNEAMDALLALEAGANQSQAAALVT